MTAGLGLKAANPDAVARLREAQSRRQAVLPVREFIPAGDVEAAYAVQRTLIADRVEAGAVITGRKIGLTSPAVQAQLGVDQPDFGVLLDTMARSEHVPIDASVLLQPKIEAEIAFVLAADITDPEVTADTVRNAVAYATPALEIVDSRIAGWDITFVDTVADNASSGLYVVGEAKVPMAQIEPREVAMTMWVDDVEVSCGTGEACLGDPLAALAWLARTAAAHGDPLRAGQLILAGALGPMAPVVAGIQVRAEFTGLGSVRASFAPSGQEN